MGADVVGFDLEATIDRRDYGLDWQAQLPAGGDVLAWDVTLQIHLELVEGLTTLRILGISGSLRQGSHNTTLLRAAASALPRGVELELYDGLRALPPYDADRDVEPAPPAVAQLRAAIARADGVMIATPEFNGSIPGVLKNALDWASRPFPDNALRGKPVAVIGASTGLFGAVWAQAETRKVLGHHRRRRDRARAASRPGGSWHSPTAASCSIPAQKAALAELVGRAGRTRGCRRTARGDWRRWSSRTVALSRRSGRPVVALEGATLRARASGDALALPVLSDRHRGAGGERVQHLLVAFVELRRSRVAIERRHHPQCLVSIHHRNKQCRVDLRHAETSRQDPQLR